jgi:hypothetical protein
VSTRIASRAPGHAAATGLDEDRRAFYTDQVLCSLHEAARRKLEEMMRSDYEFKSEFARTYVAKGEAKALLTLLEARGLDIPADVRDRIFACNDLAQLDRWIRQAVVVSDARDLFAIETRARAVLAVLDARGLEVPLDVHERIFASTDLAELEQWLRRAVVVSDARDLFATTAS